MKEAHKPGATVILTDRAGNVLHAKNFLLEENAEAHYYALEDLQLTNVRLYLIVYSERQQMEVVKKELLTYK